MPHAAGTRLYLLPKVYALDHGLSPVYLPDRLLNTSPWTWCLVAIPPYPWAQSRMAETAGLVVGGVALASLFSACVDCFEYVQLGRNFGNSHQKCLLKLDVVRLRLSRWGESVRLTGENDRKAPTFSISTASEMDLQAAKSLLGEIVADFQDVEKISQRYLTKAKCNESTAIAGAASIPENTSLEALGSQMRNLAIRRQKQSSIKQKFKWAVYEEKNFNRLIEDLTGLVNDLVELFPAAKPTQEHLCAVEVSEIAESQDVQTLYVLENVSAGVDNVLSHQVAEKVQDQRGHSFKNFTASDQAKMAIGDEIHADMQVNGYGHKYDGISASGHAKVRSGNQYGGKSFWDD